MTEVQTPVSSAMHSSINDYIEHRRIVLTSDVKEMTIRWSAKLLLRSQETNSGSYTSRDVYSWKVSKERLGVISTLATGKYYEGLITSMHFIYYRCIQYTI